MTNLGQLFKEHRLEQYKAVMRYIQHATLEECAGMIEEIRCVHDNLLAFNEDASLLARVHNVSINGECIQLNIECASYEAEEE